MVYIDYYESPLGGITLAGDGEALTGLWFDGQRYYAAGVPQEHVEKDLPVFRQTKAWLDLYFQGKEPDFTPPVHLTGSDFRQAVWNILKTIPYGKTMTYGDIAEQLRVQQGKGRVSARAVGGAVGHNPISLIVPCHRVIGSKGALTGYAGGMERKAYLLKLERQI